MTKTILSVVIVAIVVMAIAVPIIAEAGITAETKENEYTYKATKLDTSTGTHTLTFSYSDTSTNATITINGVEIGNLKTAFLIGEKNLIVWNLNPKLFLIRDLEKNYYDYCLVNSTETSITITEGVWSGELARSIAVPSIIIPSDDGELGAMETGRASPGAECYWAYYGSYQMVASGDPWQPDQIKAYARVSDDSKWAGAPSSVQTSNVGMMSMTIGNLVFDDPAISKIPTADLVYMPIEYDEAVSKVTGIEKTLIDMIPLLMVVGLMVATVAAYIKFKE